MTKSNHQGRKITSYHTQTKHTVTNTQQHKMSKQVLISLLAQGNNGNEILSILDTLVADAVSDTEEDTIEF